MDVDKARARDQVLARDDFARELIGDLSELDDPLPHNGNVPFGRKKTFAVKNRYAFNHVIVGLLVAEDLRPAPAEEQN